MATIFSLPKYIPDPTSGESVTGYEVQSSSATNSPNLLIPDSSFSDITGSPFTNNTNIVDVNGTIGTVYRAKPLRQIVVGSTPYTLNTNWSKPFVYTGPPDFTTPMYDAQLAQIFLPILRSASYTKDQGIVQVNGTNLNETLGAGQGQWVFDGTTKRFPLQYVMNDDPINVLDEVYQLVTKTSSGPLTLMIPHVDYEVDTRAAIVEFATAPASTTYGRFQFMRTDFISEDLLRCLADAVNSLSHYGINGYQINTSYNLKSMNQTLMYPDLAGIICKIAMIRMREGLTEMAMRGTTAWRDGNASADPYPSRALEFLVSKLQVNEEMLRREINTFIRGTTTPVRRGEFEVWGSIDGSTPLVPGMYQALPMAFGAMRGNTVSYLSY